MLLRNFKTVRLFSGNIPQKSDLLLAVDVMCRQHVIQFATFSIIGSVLYTTIGSYDQNQQVYISPRENMPFDILSCIGNVSLKEGKPFIDAHIILSNQFGYVIGGRLFSETIVFKGKIILREFASDSFQRFYDKATGLFLWK